MAFPESILTEDEQLRMHLHPHWKEMVRPVLVFLLGVAAVVAAWTLIESQVAVYAIGGVVVVLVAWLSLWPWVVWRTTHYIFTSDRVVLQHGVFHRERRDIPLHRVNDHSMNQTLWERMLGCGTLVIESAGERGQSSLKDVPKVQRVQTLLYELVNLHHDKHSLGDDEFRDIMEELRGGDGESAKPS